MKFKRLAALLTALILAVTMLAACGQKPIDDVDSPGVTLDQTTPLRPPPPSPSPR